MIVFYHSYTHTHTFGYGDGDGSKMFILGLFSDIGEGSNLPHSMIRDDGSWLTLALTTPRLVWGEHSEVHSDPAHKNLEFLWPIRKGFPEEAGVKICFSTEPIG